jgi:hypothetical protein
MVQSIGSNYIPLSSYALAASTGDRIAIPVPKSQALYAYFEHVVGVPAESGVSIDRLHILDSIIERLVSLKKGQGFSPSSAASEGRSAAAAGPAKLDALIIRLETELRAAAEKPALPYRPSPSLPTALAVNVLA